MGNISEHSSVLFPGPEAGRGEKAAVAVSASPAVRFADSNPSPAKGLLRRGFFGPRFSFPPEERISEVAGCLPMVSTAVSAPPAMEIADRRAKCQRRRGFLVQNEVH
jgi:hypothetical protein